MNAVSPLATSTATATTTNGPSSNGAVAGGGPVPAPAQPTLLGVKLLPAPAGKPETIHLNDGSMLVPLAKLDSRGTIRSLDDAAAPATVPAVRATPANPTAGTAARPATPAVPGGGAAGFEPKGFLYKGNYYKKFEDQTAIDVRNLAQVQDRITRGTLNHVKENEPEWQGLGITEIKSRAVDPNADRDLLNVDPNAAVYVEVSGITGTGEAKTIPSVVESDGDVFVDPRISGGR